MLAVAFELVFVATVLLLVCEVFVVSVSEAVVVCFNPFCHIFRSTRNTETRYIFISPYSIVNIYKTNRDIIIISTAKKTYINAQNMCTVFRNLK